VAIFIDLLRDEKERVEALWNLCGFVLRRIFGVFSIQKKREKIIPIIRVGFNLLR
jgi:hypothetical protein